MGSCFNHKAHNAYGKEKQPIAMIDFYVNWNNSTWSTRKRYVAIGQICPECNNIFLFDRNDYGDKPIT